MLQKWKSQASLRYDVLRGGPDLLLTQCSHADSKIQKAAQCLSHLVDNLTKFARLRHPVAPSLFKSYHIFHITIQPG